MPSDKTENVNHNISIQALSVETELLITKTERNKRKPTYIFLHQMSHRPRNRVPNPNLEPEDSSSNSLDDKNTLPVGGQTTV